MPGGTTFDPVIGSQIYRDSTRIASGNAGPVQVQNTNAVNLVGGCGVGSILNTSGQSVAVNVYDNIGAAANLLYSGVIAAGAPVVLNYKLKTGLYLTFGAALTADLIVTHTG